MLNLAALPFHFRSALQNANNFRPSEDAGAAMASAAPLLPDSNLPSRVCAIVVTFNRKGLLSRCLRAILGQTVPVERVLIVDNGCSDGTRSFLAETGLLQDARVDYWRFEKNRGPAFAFHAGLWNFRDSAQEWAWVMDDDVIADPTALEELLKGYDRAFTSPEEVGFLASCVRSPDGQMVNVPQVDHRPSSSGFPDWNHLLTKGLVKIWTTSFNSILFPKSTIIEFGLPKVDFFMWGEDIDYTRTITRKRPSYLVAESSVVHWQAIAKPIGVKHERNPDRYPYLYYYYRNWLYNNRQYGKRFDFIRRLIFTLRAFLYSLFMRPFSFTRSKAVLCGLLAGLTFEPSDASPMEEHQVRTNGETAQHPV